MVGSIIPLRDVRPARTAVIVVVLSIIYVLHHIYPHQSTTTVNPATLSSDIQLFNIEHAGSCRPLPGAEDVLVVVKTGATEAAVRIPAILSTYAQCIPNLMIFSDLEQQIEGHKIYDALKSVSTRYKQYTPEFDFYYGLQKVHRAGGNLTAFAHLDENGSEGGKAWTLDRWKSIPMLHQAYKKQPNAKWYIFVDADAFLGFHNIVQTLGKLNHTLPVYVGANNSHDDDFSFSHGGSGYVLSAGAVNAFENIYDTEHVKKWEAETNVTCCGEVMLAKAMKTAGVKKQDAFPAMQSATIGDYEWNDRSWCETPWTWHHVRTQEIKELSDFDRSWYKSNQKPYRFKYLFAEFMEPDIVESKDDWDNLSTDRLYRMPGGKDGGGKIGRQKPKEEKSAILSRSACVAACVADKRCVQWVWKAGHSCGHHWSLRLGRPASETWDQDSKPRPRVVSGWILKRATALQQEWEQKPCHSRWNDE